MESIIYLASISSIKTESVSEIYDIISNIDKHKYSIIPIEITYDTPEQPIDEGTALSCYVRIIKTKQKLIDDKKLKNGDKIIALENGIYNFNDSYYDICILMVYDVNFNTVSRYNSFGIKIDPKLINMYFDKKFNPDNQIVNIDDKNKDYNNKIIYMKDNIIFGYTRSFGKFLTNFFKIKHDNWSIDPRFGNIDRKNQIKNCLNKYLIDDFTDVIPNYPKDGVMFKHMTSITVNSILLNIMYEMLERMIKDNFDIENIDYFAGLDARGFYFAPVLARIFKKGFIPVRKANKVPKTYNYKIATESYGTEYSTDEFGLEFREDYIEKDKVKKVLILDDLLATGGSIIGAANVLMKVGLSIVGAVTVYDVPGLRDKAKEKLYKNGINYKVLINNDNNPNDFCKLAYQIPEITYNTIIYDFLEKSKFDVKNDNKFILSPDKWLEIQDCSIEDIKKIDENKMNKVTMIYTDKDSELAIKILDVMNNQMNTNINYNKARTPITTELFSNGEIRVKIDANIRDKHVIVISQIRTGFINNDYMQLILILDACQRANANKITVVMPYYPYSRSDKKDDPRCPIGAAVVAKILDNMRIDYLISVDLHAGQIQGYLDKGFHNLYMKKYICEYIYKNYLRLYEKSDWNKYFILIAPDAGAAKTVKGYTKLLDINNVIMDKERDYSKPGTIVRSRFVGSKDDFVGKTGIIIDDMADTMGTMCSAIEELIENGLKDVIIIVTHGILSGLAIERINNGKYIKEVVVSDTLPQNQNVSKSPKIKIVSSSELIARAIDGILTGRSISRLF